MRSALSLIAVTSLAACSSLSPTEDPAQLRMTDIEARLVRIERVLENESLIQLASEVNQLESELASLRGAVETLRFETENAATRQRDLYLDVDERLQRIEQGRGGGGPGFGEAQPGGAGFPGQPGQLAGVDEQAGGAGSASSQGSFSRPGPSQPSPGGASGAGSPGNDSDSYDRAFELIRARQYEEAAEAFSEFLMAFPQSPLADNAQYWLAETYYVRGEFEGALPEFRAVVDEFPRSAKLADALLKIGYCNYELQRFDEARNVLQQVARDFPQSTAARLAVQRLDRIEQETG